MLPSDLDAVVFDAGGTLVRLDYAHIAQTSRARGADVDEASLARGEAHARRAIDTAAAASGTPGGNDESRRPHYFTDVLRGAGVAEESARRIAEDLETAHRDSNLWRVPLADAGETLAGIRALGLRTAVVSNADGRIEAVLRAARLAEHLDLIVDSHVEGVEKPDPEIFRRALSRLGVPPERAVYIGDIYSIDAVGARSAGLAPVILDPTGAYGSLDCPTIAALIELVAALDGRGGGS